jgi:hypothetical protein
MPANSDPWVICDRSGFKVRMSETVKAWTGLRVARRFADKRNPQDAVRAVADRRGAPLGVPDARPEPPDAYLAGPVTAEEL